MFENIKKKSGWFEEATLMNEKGKLVAKDHHEALTRAQYKKAPASCTVACLPPCKHTKDDVVDEIEVDEIDNNQEQDDLNNKEDKHSYKKEDK